MTTIRFYHLQKQTLDQVLPVLLNKALQQDNKIVVRVTDKKEVDRLSNLLWDHSADSWIPHGSYKHKDFTPDHPVWLTDDDDNPTLGSILMMTQADIQTSTLKQYALCCIFLDGHNAAQTQKARAQWKEFKEIGLSVAYWMQDTSGKWVEKA